MMQKIELTFMRELLRDNVRRRNVKFAFAKQTKKFCRGLPTHLHHQVEISRQSRFAVDRGRDRADGHVVDLTRLQCPQSGV